MDQGGYSFLLRFIESSQFTLFHCISYLKRYSDEIGIHFYLCQKLKSYQDQDIEFFIPQLVQLHVTVETESMALEDLLLDLCNRSTHCAVLIYWQVQAHLTELSGEPESFGFQVCQRVMGKLQHILFNVGRPPDFRIKENFAPGTILASSLAGAVGMPAMISHIKPLVVSQGRKRRSHIFQVASKVIGSISSARASPRTSLYDPTISQHSRPSLSSLHYDDLDDEQDVTLDSPRIKSKSFSYSQVYLGEAETHSLPTIPLGNPFRRVASFQSFPGSSRLDGKRITILKSNYFRCETQFMTALHTISSKLVTVPPQARLSALRVEIAMLNKDLPAEVDIPLLIPNSYPHVDKDTPSFINPQPKQHKLLRICPGEAVLLNSAGRVPYLLLVEYLRNEFDFEPHSVANKHILAEEKERRHIFDSISSPIPSSPHIHGNNDDGFDDDLFYADEKDMGDISVIKLYENKRDISTQENLSASLSSISKYSSMISSETSSPRSSNLSFSPAYSLPIPEPDDITELATHMRAAAYMITQLDSAGGSKLSKVEVERIKARITASMQSMEGHTILPRSSIPNGEAGDRKLENDLKTTGGNSNNLNLGEDWLVRKERIRKASPFGYLPNWDVFSVIVKTGDDLRQEAFACQLIQAMQMCWEKADSGVWVKKYNILITHNSAGLVETITNALSIHSIKKAMTTASLKNDKNPKGAITSLSDHFKTVSKFLFSFVQENTCTNILTCVWFLDIWHRPTAGHCN